MGKNNKFQYLYIICTVFLFPNISIAKPKTSDPVIIFTYDPSEPRGSTSLVSSEMTLSDVEEIERTKKIISPKDLKKAEDRAMVFVTPKMDAEDRASLLLTASLIKDKYWKDFEKYTLRVLKGDLDGTGISLVVSTVRHLDPKQRKEILRGADKLIYPRLSGNGRSSIIKYVSRTPHKERHERVNRAKRHLDREFPAGIGHGYTKRVKQLLKTPLDGRIPSLK